MAFDNIAGVAEDVADLDGAVLSAPRQKIQRAAVGTEPSSPD